jgi:hypothetical protein
MELRIRYRFYILGLYQCLYQDQLEHEINYYYYYYNPHLTLFWAMNSVHINITESGKIYGN